MRRGARSRLSGSGAGGAGTTACSPVSGSGSAQPDDRLVAAPGLVLGTVAVAADAKQHHGDVVAATHLVGLGDQRVDGAPQGIALGEDLAQAASRTMLVSPSLQIR